MVQDQLVDYVSSQVKLGVSRDAIKLALVSAGWVAGDVEDTLKKVMDGGTAGVAATSAPMGSAPAQPSSSATIGSIGTKPAGTGMGTSASPQMIRVSDLVSGSPAISKPAVASPGMATSSSKPSTSVSPSSSISSKTSDPQFGGKISGNTFKATTSSDMPGAGGSKKGIIGGVVAVILILACAGAAWYFYSQNASLAAKVTSLTTQSASVTSQLSSLKTQMDASSTGFAAQIASLSADNADLALNLSFYAVPPGGVPTALPITINGTLAGGGKAPYSVMTTRGAKIFIGNSTNASISSQLAPMVGQTVSLTGTYVPGSDSMTVVSMASTTTP